MNRIWRSISGIFGGSGKAPQKQTQESPSPEAGKREGPMFAFVALRSDTLPDEEAMKAALAKWHEVPVGAVVKTEADSPDNRKTEAYDVDGASTMIGMMGIPIPSGDIDYACMNSFMWPDAAEAFREQTCHVIVIVLPREGESPAQHGVRLSRSIAAVTETYDAVGVYWGHGSIVHKPEHFWHFMENADSDMNSLPIPLWIGFLRSPGENGGIDVYTSGLSAFGAMECEVIGSHRKPMEIINFLSGVSAYLIDRGNVIKDGNTVGGDENERIIARHADSAIGREGKVLRIEY